MDNVSLLSPPQMKKKMGPTKQGRKRDNDEGRKKRVRGRYTTMSSSHCKAIGHNISGCPQLGKQSYQKKKKPPIGNPVGRPKKIVAHSLTTVSNEPLFSLKKVYLILMY